jgi:glycosyltransferase involved in cell wall biosynthesis
MKTILATTYAINPYKGSEDGMGWNYVMQIARFNKVIAITRENNRPQIEQYMAENPSEHYDNIQWQYFDLPYWMRFWKKGGRGAMLYYLLWQRAMVAFIKKQKLHFDIVHNLNFHNDWTPSFLWKLNKPFVWGSVGHHPLIPSQYLKHYTKSYWLKDRLTWLIKQYFWKVSPALRKTVHAADHILCMNDGVPTTLKLSSKYSVAPSIATRDFGWKQGHTTSGDFRLISAGRFVPLKGFDLSIHAYAEFFHSLSEAEQDKCELLLIGSGPEESLLKSLAQRLEVAHSIRFIPWMERNELMKKFKEASAFLFPSHEGAGMVVAEALSFGLPVLCLDNVGPGQFIDRDCGFAIPQGDYQDTVSGLALALHQLYAFPQKREKMRMAARQQFEKVFHWDRRGEQLQKIYAEL